MTHRALALAGALTLVLLAVPASASAHAVLEGTSPQRGATLQTQPRQVVLRFSETVEGNFGALRVFDASAKRVDDGETVHPGGSGSRLAVGLRAGLADGTYVATYRIISADAHPVSGGLVFSIGKPGSSATPTVAELIGGSGAGPVTEIAFGVARAATYLATALVLGGLVFLLFVWLPALRATAGSSAAWPVASGAFVGRLRTVMLAAVGLGVVAGVAGLVFQGATAGATSAWSALDPAVIGDVLGTRFGRVWGLRVLAFVVLAAVVVMALRAGRRPPPAVLAVASVPVAFLAFAPALAGHASVTPPVWLLMALDIGHVIAMSVWIGGLIVLLTVLPAATRQLEGVDRTRLLSGALLRFSPIALGCVGMLLFTGTNQVIEHVGAWDQLTGTGFGRAVLIKVALLTAVIAVAAVNRRRVLPSMRRLAQNGEAPGAAGHLLRRTLRAEVGLVVVVLGVAAALVSYPPPDTLASGPFSAATKLGPVRLEATVDPARVGPNEMHLYLLKASDGSPFTGTQQLTVTLALPSKDVGPLPARAREAGPGHYVIDTLQLVPAGEWRLRVVDRVSEFDEYETTLTVPVR